MDQWRPGKALVTSMLAIALLAPLLAAGDGAWAGSERAPGPPPGCEVRPVRDVGRACVVDGGYWVRHGDGSVAFTHGPDAAPSHQPGPDDATPDPPVCADAVGSSYYGLVVYARAHDDTDRFASMEAGIRTLVHQANGHLLAEAAERDATAEYIMHCTNGVVTVRNEVLPTDRSQADFGSIVSDLRAKGYTDRRVKHWVWYDDADACTCAGIGHIYPDDTPGPSNDNNGNGVALFAVTFGVESAFVMMHEAGHNLGAVQDSAPRSSGSGHCNDGLDVMCYADGGPTSSYSSTVCTDRQHFDCGHDDYFDPRPAPGSYLDTHWNLASTANRYLEIVLDNEAPTMTELSCGPEPTNPGQFVACSFSGTDELNDVHYVVDWGDGSAPVRVPSTGYVASGTMRSATHAYDASGDHEVSVTATDDHVEPLTSAPLTWSHAVVPNQVPEAPAIGCDPQPVPEYSTVTCSFRGDDDSTGIWYTVDWGDGSPIQRVPQFGTVAPNTTVQAGHAVRDPGSYTVVARTNDNGVPALQSPEATHTIEVVDVPCSFPTVQGTLTAGLGGVAIQDLTSRAYDGVPPNCWTEPYHLSTTGTAQFRVCWLDDGDADIACSESLGGLDGDVPVGAHAVRVVLVAGVFADYELTTG